MKLFAPKNKEAQMALSEHVQELRRRIMISAIALFVGAIIGFVWYGVGVFGLEPLGEIIRGPYCSLPQELRADLTHDGQCRLIATGPFEMFLLRIKVGAIAGIVLSSPVWMAQIWLFITPALYKKEKLISFVFLALAVMLFISGAVLAYVVLDVGLAFLLGIGNDVQVAALSGKDYYSLVQSFLLIFGVCFEVPLIIAMLNIVGLLRYRYVTGKRRIIWVFIFIFGAALSPGGEVTSMLALSLAVGLLIECSFQFCRWNDHRREKKEAADELLGVHDASQFRYEAQPIGPSTPTPATSVPIAAGAPPVAPPPAPAPPQLPQGPSLQQPDSTRRPSSVLNNNSGANYVHGDFGDVL